MKKLLSVLLSLTLILSASAAAFPVLKASAADGFRLYAYRPDGGRDIASSEMPAGVTVYAYEPSLLINGQHVFSIMLGPLFAEKYNAAYFEVPAGIGLLQIYVNGEINLSAMKMTQDGKTFYAALAANVDLQLVPMSANANLYLVGGFSGDALDAPFSLLSYKNYASACSDKASGNRLTLRTYIDMRSCKSAAGNEVTSVGPNLTVENVTFTQKTRTAVEVSNESRINVKGSSIVDAAIDGKEGTEDSFCFKEMVFASDFCGLTYESSYCGRIARYADKASSKYMTGSAGNGSTMYVCNVGLSDPAAVGAMELPADVRESVYANVASALNRDVNYKIGEKLPEFISNGPLCIQLAWTNEKGESCTGSAVEEGIAYTARVYVSLRPTNDTPPVYYTFRADSFVQKPESAKNAYLEDTLPYLIPVYHVDYPAIKAENAPVIVSQPQDAAFYVTGDGHTPERLTYSVKAENAVTYQWYAVDKKGAADTISDGDVYAGTSTNVLRVLDPSAAYEKANAFYCAVGSPLYPDVLSERAAISRLFRVSSLEITGLDAPEAGGAADASFGVTFSPAWAVPHTTSVAYVDSATGAEKTSFSAGDKLKVQVTVNFTDEEHVFQADGTVGFWNGRMVNADVTDAGKTATFTFAYNVKAAGSENVIDTVSLAMAQPQIGEPRPGFVFPADAPYIGSATLSPFDSVVKPGVEYTLTVTLAASAGLSFSESTVFELNGEPMNATFKNEKKTIVELTYTFPAKNAEIEVAEISVVIPKIGEVFDETKCTVETTGAEKDAFGIGEGTWEVECDKDGKVVADTSRALRQTLTANEGYSFTPDTAFIIRYKNDNGSDAVLILNNDLDADADTADLKIVFDPYPAVHEHAWSECHQTPGDDVNHWFLCKYCHEVVYEAHTPGGWIIDTPPTLTENGTKHQECTACGYVLKIAEIPKGTVLPDYMLGDVDGDGNITAGDARLALRAAVGLETYAPGSREYLAADVDLSNSLTAADARLILRKAVGLDVEKEGWGEK